MTENRTVNPEEAMGWMPLRLVAVSPLAGHNPARPAGPLRVVAAEFDTLFARVAPTLALRVADPAGGAAADVNLRFASLRDFAPAAVLEQIPAAAALFEPRQSQPERAGEIDALLTRWLDAVIHHPAFLELEAAWRGLHYLASRGGAAAGAMTPLWLEVLVTGAGEDFLARFRTQVFDPDYEDRVEFPMAATIADVVFDHQPASVERLATLAGLANALQSPFVAAVGAPFFGLKNLAHLPALPDLATRTSGGPYAVWTTFQRENAARWVCLTANRFLLRSPHGEGEGGGVGAEGGSGGVGGAGAGAAAAPGAAFRYRETVDPAHPEWLCWGNAAWAVGASLAASWAEHGHCAAADGLSGTGGHHGLPTRELQQSPTKKVQVTTEVILPDEKAWDLCRAGLTPIVGIANGDIAYFPFLGNVYRPRPGSITVDQALTWQLYAGQLGHVVLKLSGQMPAGDPAEACGWLERGLFAYLSPFVGDAPGTHVKVTPVAQPDGSVAAAIHVTPTFKIQDKPVELDLQLPLR